MNIPLNLPPSPSLKVDPPTPPCLEVCCSSCRWRSRSFHVATVRLQRYFVADLLCSSNFFRHHVQFIEGTLKSFFHDLVLLRFVLFLAFFSPLSVFDFALSKMLLLFIFRPSNSPVSRSRTDVTAVTVWIGLDTEFSAKLGKTRIGEVKIRIRTAVPSRNGRVLNHWS
uniref:Uncharacterized protein n=1 Tax=Opuntia streptacantha TaxID=393608 RepID=A0A7C8ZY74_OPUST